MTMLNMTNLKKAYRYSKKNGLAAALFACKERLDNRNACYSKREISAEELTKQRTHRFDAIGNPLVSVLVPAYCTNPSFFKTMVESLLAQSYANWELIIADASPSEDALRDLTYSYRDQRIHYFHLENNAGISENTNRALEQASGRYIALLDHDDFLEPDALFQMLSALEQHPDAEMVYSDEDKCNGDGSRFYEPNYKPKFNLDLILSNNYICHFLMLEANLLKRLGFRADYDGAQDHDLILRAAGELLDAPEKILHVAHVLYHWRCHEESTASNPESKLYAYEAGKRAVTDFIAARGWHATVEHSKHLGFFHVTFEDLFLERSDVAAVGGSLVHGGKIVGGPLTFDGRILFHNLSVHYSGYMNRAVLVQDVDALDAACLMVRPELTSLLEEIKTRESDSEKQGLLFGEEMAKRGLRILWDPSMQQRI